MDELDLAAIEARLAKTTPGPWEWPAYNDGEIMGLGTKTEYVIDAYTDSWGTAVLKVNDNDKEFIANAPTDIAALIQEVKRLRTEIQTMKDDAWGDAFDRDTWEE